MNDGTVRLEDDLQVEVTSKDGLTVVIISHPCQNNRSVCLLVNEAKVLRDWLVGYLPKD
jgi:hypothetical protein